MSPIRRNSEAMIASASLKRIGDHHGITNRREFRGNDCLGLIEASLWAKQYSTELNIPRQ